MGLDRGMNVEGGGRRRLSTQIHQKSIKLKLKEELKEIDEQLQEYLNSLNEEE